MLVRPLRSSLSGQGHLQSRVAMTSRDTQELRAVCGPVEAWRRQVLVHDAVVKAAIVTMPVSGSKVRAFRDHDNVARSRAQGNHSRHQLEVQAPGCESRSGTELVVRSMKSSNRLISRHPCPEPIA